MHKPVLLKEVIEFLDPQPGEFFIDGTVDGGGHAAEILKCVGEGGKVLGVDWDSSMLVKCKERFSGVRNIVLRRANYTAIPEILDEEKLPKADGLLLDLGFSSEQLEAGRGFSFSKDEPLLMTYGSESKPVAQILRELREDELADAIFKFSGERFSRKIAKAIKEKGKKKPIITTKELREAILSAVPRGYEKGRIDPATRTFQALRIYANDELANLETALRNIPKILKTGGRAAIITFHSLEDAMVKQGFREGERAGKMKILTKKPVVPSVEEIRENPRSRSAKVRAVILL